MATNRRKAWRDWCVVALLAVGGLIWAVSTDILWRQNFGVYDELVARTSRPASDEVVIVAMDDESMLRLGHFPWPRATHARVLDVLENAGARVILYDVLFLEPASDDADLARAVGKARPVLPLAMEIPGRGGASVTVVEPLLALRGDGTKIGHAEIIPDKDGIIRSAYLSIGMDDRQWAHVAAIVACEVAGAACVEPGVTASRGRTEKDRFLIPFRSGVQSFRKVPFSAVLDGGVPNGFFKDRIVLVGATAVGLSDIYATPLSPTSSLMPGVEVNANIVQALVDGHRITLAPAWLNYVIALVPVMLLLASYLFARPLGIFVTALILALSTFCVTLWFWREGIWLSPVAGIVGVGATYPLWAARRLQVATIFMREELVRFRLDELKQAGAKEQVTQFPDVEAERLREAISRSRNFQNFLRDTLSGLPDASFVMERDGTILIQNGAAKQLLGHIEGEHFSSILALISGVPVAENTSTQPEDATFPTEVTDVEGRIYNVRWSRIHNRGGHAIAWFLRLADVTELRCATRQREGALQLLTHDMRSPQVSILTLLDKSSDSVSSDVLDRVKHYARRTLALADGYVQLARAESATLSIDDVNLPDIVLDAVDDLWPQANGKGISIDTHNCDHEFLVRGDRQLLTRVLINLIDNAIKYSFREQRIECRINVMDRNVTISICDRGPGVDAGKVGKLFDRFQRGSDELITGAGLGLAFARSVVERHRGTLTYSARSGGGACFNLTLQLRDGGG